jgi:hypothetical protein
MCNNLDVYILIARKALSLMCHDGPIHVPLFWSSSDKIQAYEVKDQPAPVPWCWFGLTLPKSCLTEHSIRTMACVCVCV